MTTPTQQPPFHTLTEDEHFAIRDLWRTEQRDGKTLVQHYAAVHAAVLPVLASRLGLHANEVPPAYHDQIAHAVIGCAVTQNELRGSVLGELVAAIYLEGGGHITLEDYGRFCFCPVKERKHRSPTERHASGCDLLWQAYCNAVNALLAREEGMPAPSAVDLCVLDTTVTRQGERCPASPDHALRRTVAGHFALDEEAVQRAWEAVDITGAGDDADVGERLMAALLEELNDRLSRSGMSLFLKTVVLLVDDTAPASAIADFALLLRRWTGAMPLVVGARWEATRGWRVVSPASMRTGDLSSVDGERGRG
jgi:hypothetical protein